jgi:hypothetical protein
MKPSDRTDAFQAAYRKLSDAVNEWFPRREWFDDEGRWDAVVGAWYNLVYVTSRLETPDPPEPNRNDMASFKQLDAWFVKSIAKLEGEPSAQLETKPNNRGKNVNARMLEKMQNDPECRGWTSKQWANDLGCKPPSVTATKTWKELAPIRAKQNAERARDRQGRGAGRRRGDYGPD